jgi:DNA polymerase III delta subunit
MNSVHFIYGNQSLELEEVSAAVINDLLEGIDRENGLVTYDVEDLLGSEPGKEKKLISEFQNTCDTVSFFASKIIVHIKNLQKIPGKKSPTADIEKKLNDINLVKQTIGNDSMWFDMDSLTKHIDSHQHVTGRQIVQKVLHLGKKSFYLELNPNWSDRVIYRQSGNNQEGIEIKELIKERLKTDIQFEPPTTDIPQSNSDSDRFVTLLKNYISDPPDHVRFVLTSNMRNLREINKGISDLLSKKAKVRKLTVAYDDFNPVDWVVTRARTKNLMLDRNSAALLIEIAGTDYSILDMELNKLSLRLPNNSKITPEDLLSNTSHSKKFSIFRIANFLVQKDVKNTFESLESVIKNHPSDAVSVFGLIASQFRRLLKIAWMTEAEFSESNIVNRLKINKWVAEQAIKHSRRFTTKELENIVVQLSKSDLQIKYYLKDALIILENLCFQICNGTFKEKNHIERRWVP